MIDSNKIGPFPVLINRDIMSLDEARKKNNRLFSLAIILPLYFALLSGCAYTESRSYSIISPEVQSSGPGSNKVRITVRANVWRGQPENLNSYLTPLFVEIVNNTEKPISIYYSDFVLIDEFRNQYNAVVPEIASDIVAQKEKSKWYLRPSISIGFGTGGYYGGGYGYGIGYYGRRYPYPYYRSPFYWPYNYAYYSNYYDAYYDQDYSDIFTQALLPGIVRPGARLSGFIYFNKLPSNIKSFTLDVGYNVEIENKRYDLSFPYTILFYGE